MKRALLLPLLYLTLLGTLAAQEGKPQYTILVKRADTSLGQIVIELFPDIAPLHVRNFDSLVSIDFFDSTAFHRVIPGFVIQGGDPNTRSGPEDTWGIGDPSQTTVPAEFNVISHQRGILSAARANDPNSATSQFFICVAPATSLDGRYTVYGRVISGMDIVDTIVMAPTVVNQFGENSRPATKITMFIERTGTDTTTPSSSTLRYPADDTTRVRATLAVRWTPVPEAILYELQVSETEDFASLTFKDSTPSTVGSIRLLQLGMRDYYWRVRASNGGKRGEWSEVRHFVTGMANATLLSPANLATNVTSPVSFVWRPVNGAGLFRVQVDTVIGFAEPIVNIHTTDTSLTVPALTPDKRHQWRIFAYNEVGDSTVSARWSFTTASTSGVETVAAPSDVEATMIRLAADRYALRVTLLRPADARVTIVDASGRELGTLAERTLPAGSSDIAIDASSLRSGHYLVRIEAAGSTISRRLVIVR